MNLKENKEFERLSRRVFLKRLGGAVLVISVAGLAWRMIDQGVFSTGKGPAYEAWNSSKDNLESGPLALVNDAILASNPHNTQPWLFKVTDSFIEIYADESRNLGAFDPMRREMFIGLGCAIENMMLSANAHGYNPKLIYKPSITEPDCIARIDLTPGAKKDSPLYQEIPHRHTHRGKYDTDRQISKSILADIKNLIADEKKVKISWIT